MNVGLRIGAANVLVRTPPSINIRNDAMTISEIDCCETYLWRISTNPLSLKQLCRIKIRDRLIEKMKDFNFIKEFILSATPTPDAHSPSILHNLVLQLADLPRILHHYLYELPDIPSVPNDIDVFINY